MGFAGNKATVIEASFTYPYHKGFLITLHVLLFNELLNTTGWVAVKASEVHFAYEKNTGGLSSNLERLCCKCWKIMSIHAIPIRS